MAALALIKQAEALRTELHYRPGTVSKEDLTAQINQAKAGYADAIERSSFNPSLMAKAKFGLGLCEEELGNFAEAEQIYQYRGKPQFRWHCSSCPGKIPP
ncbi:MAG: hypothetical protein ACYS19_09345, partial [Planctomycetota bacterium]|jgi:hypothetical protein